MGNAAFTRATEKLDISLSLASETSAKPILRKDSFLFAHTLKKICILPCCAPVILSVNCDRPFWLNLRGTLHFFLDQTFRNRASCGEEHDPILFTSFEPGGFRSVIGKPLKKGIEKIALRRNDFKRVHFRFHVDHSQHVACSTCPLILHCAGKLNGISVQKTFFVRLDASHHQVCSSTTSSQIDGLRVPIAQA